MDAERQAREELDALLQCPRCDGKLAEITLEDVKVDRCNSCQGIWLDAGELESLTKREGGGWLSRLWGGEKQG